jgi:HK97 gp10 family phage protein
MAGGIRVSVEGLEEVQRALLALPAHVRQELAAKAIRPAGEMVRDAVKAAAPVLTGRLRNSIELRETQIAGEPSGVVLPNRKRRGGGHHAHLVEHGTVHSRARPFFHPATDAAEPPALDTMERIISDGIEAHWRAQGARA